MPQNTDASTLIHRHLSLFGNAVVESQLPNAIDGLKPVHRRILVSIKDGKSVIRSIKVVSDAMELHPHGDQSIYHAAVRLGQTFEYHPRLLDFESNCGSYSNPVPAQMKYTSLRVAEFTHDVFFEHISYDALPRQLDELLVGYEPVYLAPAIPTALLYANNAIGYGDSSYTLPHNLADVCDLVIGFTQHQKQHPFQPFDYVKYIEKFLPDFPIRNTLTNHQELLDAYRRGDFTTTVRLDGEVHLTADSISIKTLPYGVAISPDGADKPSLTERIEQLLAEKGSWFDRNLIGVKPLSEEHEVADIYVRIKRGTNVFEAWEQLRKRISFSSTVKPIPNYNNHGYVVSISQPNLLQVWYEARYNIVVASKKLRVMSLTRLIRQVEALLIICDNIDDVVQIIRHNDNHVAILQERFDLTQYQAEYIAGARLDTLSKTAKHELQRRLDNYNSELRDIRDSFTKIPDEMAATALAIKKKYATPRRTKIPHYIGYVKIDGGCIQLDTIDEIPGIIADFPKVELEIYIYDGPHLYKVGENNKLEKGFVPKITMGDIYGLKSEHVVTVNITEGTACCVKGFIPGLRKEGYFYTTPHSRVITRKGEIRAVEVIKVISPRKTISRGASTNIIYVYPEPRGVHYIIAMNTATPNVIVIQRVTEDHTKITMNPTGEVHLIHSANKHTFFNLPLRFLNRISSRVVEFLNIEELLNGKAHIRIDLGETKTKTNKLINLL